MLEVRGLEALDDRHLSAVHDFNLDVHSGEIVGIAGVSGNGQREMAQAIAGLRPIKSGTVKINGSDLSHALPVERFRAGLGYVPEDRLGVGLAPRLSVVENAILRNYKQLRQGPLLIDDKMSIHCQDIVDKFGVRTGPLNEPIAGLSLSLIHI